MFFNCIISPEKWSPLLSFVSPQNPTLSYSISQLHNTFGFQLIPWIPNCADQEIWLEFWTLHNTQKIATVRVVISCLTFFTVYFFFLLKILSCNNLHHVFSYLCCQRRWFQQNLGIILSKIQKPLFCLSTDLIFSSGFLLF